MDAISAILEQAAKAAKIPKIGTLGQGDAMSILSSGGRMLTRYRDGSEKSQLAVQLFARGNEQKAVISRLSEAADKIISGARSFSSDGLQVMTARLATAPSPVAVNSGGEYIYQEQISITYISKIQEV